MTISDILTKQPFYRLTNGGKEAQDYNKPMFVDNMKYTERRLIGSVMTQADYLEEFYPFSQRVMSDFYFPEFYNYTEKVGEDGKTDGGHPAFPCQGRTPMHRRQSSSRSLSAYIVLPPCHAVAILSRRP